MWEVAAFGFVALVWWTWPCIAFCVLASVWLAMWSHGKAEERAYAASGPHPCLAYMGWGEYTPTWCFLSDGHTGEHKDQFGFSDDDPDRPDGQ